MLCRKLYLNIAQHSSSYLAIIALYFISLYKFLDGDENVPKTKIIKTALMILIPAILAVLGKNKISILQLVLKYWVTKYFLIRHEIQEAINRLIKVLEHSLEDEDLNDEIITKSSILFDKIYKLQKKIKKLKEKKESNREDALIVTNKRNRNRRRKRRRDK